MSKMTKKTGGPYMQQAGRGNMKKTGRGVPVELMGPAMHEPGHIDPPSGTRTDPAKGVIRPGNSYQPRYEAGASGPPQPLIGPTPRVNADTGQESVLDYNSASIGTLGQSGNAGNSNPTRHMTTRSQEIAREAVRNGRNKGIIEQKQFTEGKDVVNKTGQLITDFSNRGGLADAALRSIGMSSDNVDQGRINSIISGSRRTGREDSQYWNAIKAKDILFDGVKTDSLSRSNTNRVYNANTQYENDAPTVRNLNASAVGGRGPNMKKKK